MQEGIAAARAGDAERARACLLRVVEATPAGRRNVQAWYWLSRVVESPEEREICLENVLALDPGHTAVHRELSDLRRRRPSPPAPLPRGEGEQAGGKPEACSTSAIPHTAEAGPVAPVPALWAGRHREQLISDAAVEPLHCPYCGALSAAGDRQCPVCDRHLYVRERKSKDHSFYSLGLVIAWFGLANYIWLALCATYLWADFSYAVQGAPAVQRTFEALGNWLGLLGDVGQASGLPYISQSVRPGAVTPVLVAGGAAFLCSLLVAWGLYRRLRFFYWLTVGLILLGPLAIVYLALQAETLPVL